MPNPEPPQTLPERLRLGTRDLHAQTERTGAMAALLAGRLSRPGYCAMLRNLLAIYAALEDGAAASACWCCRAALESRTPAPRSRVGR